MRFGCCFGLSVVGCGVAGGFVIVTSGVRWLAILVVGFALGNCGLLDLDGVGMLTEV